MLGHVVLKASAVMSVTTAPPFSLTATPIHFWNALLEVSVAAATSAGATSAKAGVPVMPVRVTVANGTSASPMNTVYLAETSRISPRATLPRSAYWVQPFFGQ